MSLVDAELGDVFWTQALDPLHGGLVVPANSDRFWIVAHDFVFGLDVIVQIPR
jgi:hypothetical protein